MPYPPNGSWTDNPKFQQRHYIAVADELQTLRKHLLFHPNNNTHTKAQRMAIDATLTAVTNYMSNMFRGDNCNFNPERFSRACDYTPVAKQECMDVDT